MKGVVLFYIGSIAFAVGIFIRSLFAVELPTMGLFALIGISLLAVWRRSAATSPRILLCSLAFVCVALGMFRLEWASWSEVHPDFEDLLETEVSLRGTVVREPDERESATHLYVDVHGETLLVVADPYATYAYGDSVAISGTLRKPEAFESDLGRTFDYPGYLHARGVHYTLRYAEVTVIGNGAGNPALAALLAGKHAFMRRIETLLPEPHAGLSEGLLLGVKRALGEELERDFRTTGIIHIVVLSGYNVMLVVAFVTYLLGVLMPQRYALPFGLAAIACFALLVGLSATVVRASIMAALVLIARWQHRTYLVIRALVLAGVAMLALNPYLLAFDTGFQLSFLATLGLILVAPHIEARFRKTWYTIGIRGFFAATLATQFFVMPVLLYQIGEFSVVAVIVNVLVLPMVPVAMLLTFLTGVIGLVSASLGGFLAIPTYFSLQYILSIASWFAGLPFASFVVPPFPFYVVPLAYAFIGLLLFYLNRGINAAPSATLDGWVIESEDEVRIRIAAESRSDSAASKLHGATPAFFR